MKSHAVSEMRTHLVRLRSFSLNAPRDCSDRDSQALNEVPISSIDPAITEAALARGLLNMNTNLFSRNYET
jgi:hypothetical protein